MEANSTPKPYYTGNASVILRTMSTVYNYKAGRVRLSITMSGGLLPRKLEDVGSSIFKPQPTRVTLKAPAFYSY